MLYKQALNNISENFRQKTGTNLILGAEQEFYVTAGSDAVLQDIIGKINAATAPLPFFGEVEKEKGEGQYEVQISATDNPAILAEMIELLRNIIKDTVQDSEADINFSAKPYNDKPGSALHIHVNLLDEQGQNLFARNGEEESEFLLWSIAGLLELMPASMKYFAPYEEAYARYIDHGMNSPSTISWGADNRTVALRLPSVPLYPQARRIEHRVPCADADPYLTIAAIIAGVEFGVVNKLENKHEKIWGNAFLPQYTLSLLPHSFKEAQNISNAYLEMVLHQFSA